MITNRRNFLKLLGASAAGFTVLGPGQALAEADKALYELDKRQIKGKQFGMVVDTRKLDDNLLMDKIIRACHTTHNVPTISTNQNVKWIWKEDFEGAFTEDTPDYLPHKLEHKSFLLLCNHCEQPSCVRVCPTKATYKRESDGIVMMDMHRCIGCRFCMAACPYGARSFNFGDPRPHIAEADFNPTYPTRMRGVVEKCTFCVERLAEGKAPACVEASGGALIFGDLKDEKSPVRKVLADTFAIRRKPTLGTHPSVYYII